jgi:hypothetical protein
MDVKTSRLLMTREHDFDLGSGFAVGSQTVTCLGSLTDVFHTKILWTEVQSCLVHAS